jgi:excisionase family DNA binding protein
LRETQRHTFSGSNAEELIWKFMKRLSLPEEDPILTTREAARLLGVAVSTAQLWIESGAIASWKTPGGHRRVRLSSVMALLQQQETKGASGQADTPNIQPIHPEFLPGSHASYPMPADEEARLRQLAALRLIDTPDEAVFDRLTWLASQVAETPIALISLLTSQRQWFKSRIGLDVCETPRDWAFCSHAILENSPLIVKDAHQDQRFYGNPLVTGEPFIRFYAGFPLITKNQLRLGTLCILDRQPRQLNEEQLRAVHELACIASEEIQRRE